MAVLRTELPEPLRIRAASQPMSAVTLQIRVGCGWFLCSDGADPRLPPPLTRLTFCLLVNIPPESCFHQCPQLLRPGGRSLIGTTLAFGIYEPLEARRREREPFFLGNISAFVASVLQQPITCPGAGGTLVTLLQTQFRHEIVLNMVAFILAPTPLLRSVSPERLSCKLLILNQGSISCVLSRG